MADRKTRSSRIWPSIPRAALDYEIPGRFRGLGARLRDPDRVLVEFIEWLETERSREEESMKRPESGLQPRKDSTPEPEPPPPPENGDRRVLVDACINVLDHLDNEALRDRLIGALSNIGVEAVSVDGETFDPDRHQAVYRMPTTDPDQHNRIASTQRVGFLDHGRTIRLPEVAVWREDA